MGYATRPEIVEQNTEILSKIKTAIDRGDSIKFRIRDSGEISREQYRLRRILAATDNHPLASGGEFARLGARTALRIDAVNSTIIASPRSTISTIEAYRANERDALTYLDEAKGSLAMIEFYPSDSFSIEAFSKAALEKGWKLFPEAGEASSDGKLSMPAERAEPSTTEAFDASRWLRE